MTKSVHPIKTITTSSSSTTTTNAKELTPATSKQKDDLTPPPSSICGSECLYSALDIHKFFNKSNDKSAVVPSTVTTTSEAAAEETTKVDVQKEDKSSSSLELHNDEHLKDFCCDRDSTVSYNKPTSSTNSITTLVKAKQPVERQKKFGFYNSNMDFILHDLQLTEVETSTTANTATGDATDMTVSGKVERTTKKQVRFVPISNIMHSLFSNSDDDEDEEAKAGKEEEESIVEPCTLSLASSLSTFDDQDDQPTNKDSTSSSNNKSIQQHYRLPTEQRTKTINTCYKLRKQITSYEDTFLKKHGRPPTSHEDKSEQAELLGIYKRYKQLKLSIRNDASTKIQSLWRGVTVRDQWNVVINAASEISRAKLQVRRNVQAALEEGSSHNASPEATGADVVANSDVSMTPPPSPPSINNTVKNQDDAAAIVPLNSGDTTKKVPEEETIKEMANKFIHQLDIVRLSLATTLHQNKVVHNPSTPLVTDDEVNSSMINRAIQEMLLGVAAIEAVAPLLANPDAVTRSASRSLSEEEPIVRRGSSSINILPTQISSSLITTHLSTTDKSKIATKALSSKLQTKLYTLPTHTNAPEAICDICDMPKLVTLHSGNDAGHIIEECFVCEALLKKIVKKIKKEHKNTKLVDGDEMEDEQVLLKSKAGIVKVDKKKKTYKEYEYSNRDNMDWSTSVPSTLHLPVSMPIVKTGVSRMKKERRHEKSMGSSTSSDASDTTSSSSQEEERVISPSSSTTSDDDPTKGKKKTKNKETLHGDGEDEEEEKGEYDDLLDDVSIEKLQRTMRGCPSPFPSDDATAGEKEADVVMNKKEKSNNRTKKNTDKKSKKQRDAVATSNDQREDLFEYEEEEDNDKSYGGFASKSEYNKFQRLYNGFEKDHSDVVDYVRDRVSHRSGRESRAAAGASSKHHHSHANSRRIHRSSSMPSLSSFSDSRDFDDRRRYHETRRGGRSYRDYHHYHTRGGNDSCDSLSELSKPPYYYEDDHQRHYHHHRGHPSGRYVNKERRHHYHSRPIREEYHRSSRHQHARSKGRRYHDDHHHCRHYSHDDSYTDYEPRRHRRDYFY